MASIPHPAALPENELLRDCEIRQTRGSGPGGQHRNKVSTMLVIRHRPSGLVGQAGERRSQQANREQAIRRLRIALALGIRQDRAEGVAAGLPEFWKRRLASGEIRVSAEHRDFPAALALVLDAFHHRHYDLSSVAGDLGCSASQLVRLLAREPEALLRVNRQRDQLGLRPLRS